MPGTSCLVTGPFIKCAANVVGTSFYTMHRLHQNCLLKCDAPEVHGNRAKCEMDLTLRAFVHFSKPIIIRQHTHRTGGATHGQA